MNTCFFIFLNIFLGVELLGLYGNSTFSFLRKLPDCLPCSCSILHSHSQVRRYVGMCTCIREGEMEGEKYLYQGRDSDQKERQWH